MVEQWYDRHPDRMDNEIEVMRKNYEQVELIEHDSGHRSWIVELTPSNLTYTVEIAYPTNYPIEAPEAYPITPEIEASDTKHMWKPDTVQEVHPEIPMMCLFKSQDESWDTNNTAQTFTAWVGKWLHMYEVYKEQGWWPGEEAEH